MNRPLSPLPATLCLIIAFLSVCLAWLSNEYLNLETKSHIVLISLTSRIDQLELKVDDVVDMLKYHTKKEETPIKLTITPSTKSGF